MSPSGLPAADAFTQSGALSVRSMHTGSVGPGRERGDTVVGASPPASVVAKEGEKIVVVATGEVLAVASVPDVAAVPHHRAPDRQPSKGILHAAVSPAQVAPAPAAAAAASPAHAVPVPV